MASEEVTRDDVPIRLLVAIAGASAVLLLLPNVAPGLLSDAVDGVPKLIMAFAVAMFALGVYDLVRSIF